MPRLDAFLEPFIESMARQEQYDHASTYVKGLLSDLEQKNVESIAYRFGQERLGLQKFIGISDWDDELLRMVLAEQVGQQLGEQEGIISFDPSGFKKSGKNSVGTKRQWLGRFGKVDNGQVAVYLGYVSSKEHALVDTRLYLPKEWADDKKRRKQAGVPEEIRYKTRHQLSLQMLDEKGSLLPHSWITGDDEMGRPYWFRRALDKRNEQYLLAIPSNTLIRDMDAEPPAYKGVGQPPKRPWQHVDKWIKSLHENEWTTIDVRDGAKGPLEVQIVKRRVAARTNQRRQAPQETLVVTRYRNRDEKSATETDYHLSNAPYDTTLEEFARVAKGHHRIEECFQRAKGEAGLADYQVRNWRGWHHHQTLCLIGCWFLVTETRRGKKMDTGNYPSTDTRHHRSRHSPTFGVRNLPTDHLGARALGTTKRARTLLPLETT